jgi:hypothetical protein
LGKGGGEVIEKTLWDEYLRLLRGGEVDDTTDAVVKAIVDWVRIDLSNRHSGQGYEISHEDFVPLMKRMREVMAAAKQSHVHYHYQRTESTYRPVVDGLKDL